MNREAWLNAMAERMAPRFEELGFPLPKFRAAIGFTSGGMRSAANGECWHPKSSADGVYEILIRPDVAEPYYAAAILFPELPHASLRWTGASIEPGKKPIVVSKIAKALRVGEEVEPVDEPASTAKPKQGTRLKKASCPECGYTVRVTQKWLDVGPPHCPEHGAMTASDDGTEAETEKEE